MIREEEVKKANNQCIDILNKADLSKKELVITLAQLLIYGGQAITGKTIDIYDMNLDDLYKEYYANNKENDIGLGLILNGASIMTTVSSDIKCDETAN